MADNGLFDNMRKQGMFAGWQSVGKRSDGRNVIKNPDGRYQTEYQATVNNPYGPGYINIPTVFGGNPPVDEETALRIMMENDMVDPDTGSTHYQQSFPTPEAAVQASMKNSKSIRWQPGGAILNHLLGKE